jgi:hypothetical protein
VALTLATLVVLVIVTGVINVIVFQYGKGVVRSALDEGVRAGSRYQTGNSTAACEARIADALHDMLGGPMGRGVSATCTDNGARIVATAHVHFKGWFGSISDHDSIVTASAARESS